MTDFQHPAEQSAEGGDFFSGKATYPMYQYSVFLNGSRDEQLVVRAATFAELLAGKNNVQKVLAQASQPVDNHHDEQRAESQEGCRHPSTRTQVVKKVGPNIGRLFTVCQTCDQFLGFV
ncbi:MAG: hypothetical protein KC441_17550 [Anaerolineales bacterium]|nr:hypothetical protein [Anaerolineales bacterium]